MGYLLQNGGLGMAGDWIITGGRPLQGRVEVPAAKNSVLPLLAASLLCSGPVRLQNVPRLTDVEDCLALLQGVGCTAGWQGAELVVQGQPMRTDLAPEAAGRMRASILFCAPLLARLGAGKHCTARGLPYRGKTHRPAFAGAGADGRAAAARSARTAYTVRPGGAAGRRNLS